MLPPTLALAAALVAFAPPSRSDDAPSKGKEPTPPKAATVKAEKGPLTHAVTLKATAEAGQATELAFRPKAWVGGLPIKKVVDHGAAVKAGDTLIEFDTDKVELAVRDAQQERDLAALAIRLAELELPVLERQLPIDLAAAERDAAQTADDLARFLKIDKPLAVEAADKSLKNTAFYLETARDELKQLSKMYQDKDLTDETEEIVLKRYKQSVAQAEFAFKQAEARNVQTLKVDLPRREQTAKDLAAKASIARDRATAVAPLTVRQKKLAYAKLKYDDTKAQQKLADLEKDLASMTVTAPADGIVYHGRLGRGPGPGAGPAGPLAVNGTVAAGEVFMTVVNPDAVVIRADADEKEVAMLKAGMAGKLSPAAFPDRRLAVELTKVAAAPLGGKFEVKASVAKDAGGFVPGMTGMVRFVVAKKDAAVTVPSAAVFEDDADESKYVYKLDKSEKPERVAVTTGLTVGDRTEVLTGVAAGDSLSTTKPSAAGGK